MQKRLTLMTLTLAYLALIPCLTIAQPNQPFHKGHPVIESMHAGPGDELTLDDEDGCCDESEGGDGPIIGYEEIECPYCVQHNYEMWCPHCGYCPMWDDTGVLGEWDTQPSWPSRNEDPLLRQLEW